MTGVLASIPPPPTNGVRVGPLFFHLYGLVIAVGILFAVSLARRRWQALGRDPAELERPMFWAVVFGFLGGRLGYVITHTGDFRGRWLHVLAIWEGGLALYGGLTLGILAGILVARRQGLPVLLALDAAIPGIPLAQAFGRWGNYFNQELFGTPTTLPWALEVEPDHRPERYADFATFHPTFLYESLYNLLVVGVLLWLSRRRALRTGSIVLAYLALYGLGRFFLELLRTDTTYRLFGLSRNAYVSLAVVVGASTWLWLRQRRGRAAASGGEKGDGTGELAPVPAAGPSGGHATDAEEPPARDTTEPPPPPPPPSPAAGGEPPGPP
jgi:prolipoprotein diacylglyceryl transferase